MSSKKGAPSTPSKDAEEKVIKLDPRAEWLGEQIISHLKLKSEKWEKLVSTQDNCDIIQQFLDTPEVNTLLFILNARDDLLVTLTFPSSLKKKGAFVLKNTLNEPIAESLENNVTIGELASNPLDYLNCILEEVYLPLLTNSKNMDSWPEVVATDVLRHFYKVNGAVYVISGKTKGKTLLPLPRGNNDFSENDKALLHTLESAVIDWTYQIKEVIKSSSATPLEEGLNPTPQVEIDFWEDKEANLKCIYQQLSDDKFQSIADLLQTSKSTYYPAFQQIFDDVKNALEEATDINLHLTPLRPLVETLSSTSDFNEMIQQFPPLLHVIMLIWNHSKYYNIPGRVIVILQEICNEIIEQAQNYIQPNELFGSEPDEALEKINLVLHVCTKFKTIYFEYKAKIAESERPWNFDTKLAFSRFDQFILRIKQLSEFFDTIIEFNRLEKIEIGGTKGKILSSEVVDIFNEFTTTFQEWTKIEYDVLDLNNYKFREDLAKFQDKISDLDRRIGTIICQAFDDCSSIHSRFRLIEGFSGLLARPIIGEIFENKYYDLLKEYDKDLDEVNLIFLKLKSNPSIHYNMAPVTGALQWTHELKERISSVMEKFKELNHKILFESEEAKLIKIKYDEIYRKLDEYEQETFKDWSDNIINDSEANLDKPLLTRSIQDSLSLFKVNFDPKVIALLKEVKYLGSLGIQAPEKAQSVYDKDEIFRNNIFELDHVVSQYNNIKLTVLDVERPLIQERVNSIDKQFEQALSVINWRSDIIDDFIKSIKESVGALLKIIQTGKNNIVQMQNLMKKWYSAPLIERKDSKKPLNLDDKDAKLKTIYDLIQNDGKTIFNYLEDTRRAYNVDKNDPNWRNYADYVDSVVADGFFNTIKCSLTYFLDNMDIEYLKKCELSPILDSRIEFIQNKLTFTPSIDEDATNSFMNIFLTILRDIYQVSVLMKRVNSPNIEAEYITGTSDDIAVKSESNNQNDDKNDNEIPSEEKTEENKESTEETKETEETAEGNTEQEETKKDENESENKNESENENKTENENENKNENEDPKEKEDSENDSGSKTNESSSDSKENEMDEDEGYLGEMLKNPELEELKNQLISRVRDIIDDCKKYLHSFDQFSYLWEKDRDEWMVTFLETPYERSVPQEVEEENKEEKEIANDDNENENENNQNDDNDEQIENEPMNKSSNDEIDDSSMLKLEKFEVEIRKFENIHKTIMALDPEVIFRGWLKVDAKPLKQSLNIIVKKWSYTLTKYLSDETTKTLNEMNEFITNTKGGLQKEVVEGDYDALVYSMGLLHEMKKRNDIGKSFEPLRKTINLLRQFGVEMPEDIHKLLNDLPEVWDDTKKLSQSVKEVVAPLQAKEVDILQQKCNKFEMRNYNFKEEFRQKAPFMFNIGCSNAYELINECHFEVLQMEQECQQLRESCELFELNCPQYKQLSECRKDISMLKTIWDYVGLVNSTFDDWKLTLWTEIDPDVMEQTCREFSKELRKMDKEIKSWNVYSGVDQHVKDMITSLRAVGELRSNAIRERHWKQLMKTTGVTFVMTDDMKFKDLLSLQLHRYEDDVRNIVDRATKELSMEKVLNDLSKTWGTMEFEYKERDRKGTYILISSEELVETLEDNQVMLQNLMTSKYVSHFEEQITGWQEKLSTVDTVMTLWLEVQKTWSHLENIFLESEDIRQQLPEDSKRFDGIDSDYNELMKNAINTPNAIEACSKEGLNEKLEYLQQKLALCEKSLAEYLETKRLAFPRFYFVSASDLLDILAKGNIPHAVAIHLQKLFDSISKLEFIKDENGNYTKTAIGMYSKEDEYVQFKEPLECVGPVEVWLNHLVDTMRMTLRHLIGEAVSTYEEKPRDQWIFDHPAQVTLTGSQIWWATEVNASFARLEEGYENSMKEYYKKQCNQLTTLITLIQGELSKLDRQMIMTVCTLDVHARDIVGKLVQEKAENAQCFSWQSQLRLRWDEEKRHCIANICDAQFTFCYEYLGDTPRLVITPLTDRCYITLTQSLHLIMGGAPAGPAGTGKTETVKDLGRALTVMVYVFNCSEQMDYRSIGNIYKGLAQSGAWGCFDEFNRISVEVLSVVATQVKSIEDGLRAKKKRFIFQGEEISLESTVGFFITMNPGYAGRTELPENIKALFRPCSMVVPNLELICEIMLMAEGFVEASILARKFHTLYKLNKELLSKQDHYDWGLRAIKSVLVVAGSLKRSDPGVPEEHVLMRALRDFNLPKIVTDDLQVFNGLINDLFPKIDIPRKRNLDFENDIKKSTIAQGLQAEDTFVLKVVQLEELLAVRHCVFIIGNAGSGKSEIWKMLAKTYNNNGKKCVYADLNPKAVSTNDLFGYINPATREWKDGLFSSIMRDMFNISGPDPKWIILDGDIDPNWIESLNTVMDDNKVLTLASNERIPMKPAMRLIFEIGDLKYATPATVSRAGILYVNTSDLGWNPYVQSWLAKLEDQSERTTLSVLFDKYVNTILDTIHSGRFKMAPVEDNSMVATLCNILEGLIFNQTSLKGCDKEIYEIYFVFSAVWAFGGSVIQDQLVDYRVEFSKWWNSEFKTVKFPPVGTVFDYYIDNTTRQFAPWTDKIPKFEYDPEMPLQNVMVHTSETIRIKSMMDILTDNQKAVLLLGNAGCGKTVLMQNKLNGYADERLIVNIAFNYYTTAWSLQGILEKPLEKKAGRNYGPPGTKKLIYFLDDLNMPEVDCYGTASPHTLLRQHIDYNHWYDRTKLTLKDIHNCQYVACMNPTAGSFTINPRLQRHFAVFSVSFPTVESLQTIYQTILTAHLQQFPNSIQKYSEKIVNAALQLHKKVSQVFLPTAIKFHYVFNMRDLSNIFQGILFSTKESIKEPTDIVRLFLHETRRVYGDKLLETTDMEQLINFQTAITKKVFDDLDQKVINTEPLIFAHFAGGIGEPRYIEAKDWASLKKILDDALDQYNEINAAMNLVLFEDAISHICRINRILESPRGNALLVGVGGSGKQSLSRLASYISSMDVFQIVLRKGYGVADLKLDLAALFQKCGLKQQQIVFLLTDAQIADEGFLVLINDLLASGNVPGLFPDDETETIINAMRNEAKAQGLLDTREICWNIFINFVRKNLKVVLCFSPVGNLLRSRCRKFPAIVNCTSIDWFHEWPEEALIGVAKRFVAACERVPEELRDPVTKFMAYAHLSVNEVSKKYLLNEKRYNYTTPKSFLALISLYEEMLEKKHAELIKSMDRLENGLTKLQSTSSQVDDLKAKLAVQEVELKQKNEEAELLIERVSVDTEKVNKEKAIADQEEKKVDQITKEVSEKQAQCEQDLLAAEPALEAASQALNTLNKANLTELKSFGTPAEDVKNVVSAVMVLLSPPGKIAKDRSWKAGKNMMAKVDGFLDTLINFNKENIDQSNLDALAPYLADPNFNADYIRTKSFAAAGLCSWVVNIVQYYKVYRDVEPKRIALQQANNDLQQSQEKLRAIQEKIEELDRNLAELKAQFEKATADKLKCEEEANATQETIALANRLVNGLASEKVRWSDEVANFKEQEKTLAGDVLLAAAFISYVGCFSKSYRTELLEEKWLTYMRQTDSEGKPFIPMSAELDPLDILTSSAEIARWNNEELPTDRMSLENATMVTNCKRWPLIIDPQLQGIKWIKAREGENLKVIRLGQRGYLDTIEKAISDGDPMLIEDIGIEIDPVLNDVLGRNTIKKGKYIKIGDKEVEYNPNFKLILQTRMANPHYPPEIQAQTTLINFTVTLAGLEDQLLADVVNIERADLEKTKADLTKQQNEFKIRLTELEDALLSRLSSAQGNFLGDTALVENLETTKSTSTDIEEQVKEAKLTEKSINETRELYRPVAARSSLLYFLLNDLYQIHPMYQFSLNAYKVVFQNAIHNAEPSEDIKERVNSLIDNITYSVCNYTNRGLFEKDKLIFTAQMVFQIMITQNEIDMNEFNFLLRTPRAPNVTSPFDWLSNQSWAVIKALSDLDEFKSLANDIEGSAKQWKKYYENEVPENEKLPQEWKNKNAIQKLCILRALRPDRMTYAVRNFIVQKMGAKYVDSTRQPLSQTYTEMNPSTPIFFILSPGVDPVKEVELLGRQLNFTEDNGNFHNVSLGQGQEVIAEQKLDIAYEKGGWVMLENIHLVAKWLPTLAKKLEALSVGAHKDFRVFLSAEPASDPSCHVIPTSILQVSIKITNEPPTGMKANIHRALDNFSQETLERCSKDIEFKTILFTLCYFHAVVLERRKFGTQGWNRSYPFNTGDLTICIDVLYNYLETFPKVPWTDLRYMFGDIMYGGHISDDWDRRLCSAYLDVYLKEEMLDGNFELAPGFSLPPPSDYKMYHQYIDEYLPPESPYLYGLHPNAEIGVLTSRADELFRTILEMAPKNTSGAGSSSKEEKVKQVLDEIMEKLPESFNMAELMGRVEERTPYISVALQECDRMVILTNEIRRSLKELDLGLKGDLTISEPMETLMNSIYLNAVPTTWERLAYPSLQSLSNWYIDLLQRIRELENWVQEFSLPTVLWISGLFNPQSFLTAIMQTTARKMEWPLDRMVLQVEVSKKTREDYTTPPREGAAICGLFMEGARWDTQTGMIQESQMKVLTPAMPVIQVKAIPVEKKEVKGIYECPLYRTRNRGPTYIWTFNLKTKEVPQKWVLSGVCLLMSVD